MNAVFSQGKITDQDFHHVAVTKKGSEVEFYIDGVACPQASFDSTFTFGASVAVGARPDSLVATFIGVIDEVAVFNRPLSADEVKSVYESQK